MIMLILRLLKRRKYKQFKVVPIDTNGLTLVNPKSDSGSNDLGSKFDSTPQYFKLGGVEDYQVTD